MDLLSALHDDLLVKILSFLPTIDTVNTSLLSKRWYSLWKYVPTLTYGDPKHPVQSRGASRFVDKLLLLHKAPVLDTLDLTLDCPPSDIETWIRIAVSRGIRDLIIDRSLTVKGLGAVRFPRDLFTCETLVQLYLHSEVIVDYVPSTICLRSLKNLFIAYVKFSSDELVRRFFSGCPVLMNLVVYRGNRGNVKTFTIDVPSLRRLTIFDFKYGGSDHVPGDDDGFVIKTPSLTKLTITNLYGWSYSLVKMPYLVDVDIKLPGVDSLKFIECLISAKYASLCLPQPMDSRPIGIFSKLVSLHICPCSLRWYRLILSHAPKLRKLKFNPKHLRGRQKEIIQRCCTTSTDVQTQWKQPSSIPECLISSLKTVEWIDYKGTETEKNIVMYLLENSIPLEMMGISFLKSINDKEKLNMLQQISSTRRSSSKCQLQFI